MATYGATEATHRTSHTLSISPMTSIDEPETVLVYVRDYNGIAQLVKVPVGTTLRKLVTVAFKDPKFKHASFRGFEEENLAQHQRVTAADAARWTADKPLRLKYKIPSRKEQALKFVAKHNGWIVALVTGALNVVYTIWRTRGHGACSGSERGYY